MFFFFLNPIIHGDTYFYNLSASAEVVNSLVNLKSWKPYKIEH